MHIATIAQKVALKIFAPLFIIIVEIAADIAPPNTVKTIFCLETFSKTENPNVPNMQVMMSSNVFTPENDQCNGKADCYGKCCNDCLCKLKNSCYKISAH